MACDDDAPRPDSILFIRTKAGSEWNGTLEVMHETKTIRRGVPTSIRLCAWKTYYIIIMFCSIFVSKEMPRPWKKAVCVEYVGKCHRRQPYLFAGKMLSILFSVHFGRRFNGIIIIINNDLVFGVRLWFLFMQYIIWSGRCLISMRYHFYHMVRYTTFVEQETPKSTKNLSN